MNTLEPPRDGYTIGMGVKNGKKGRDIMFFVEREDFSEKKAKSIFERLLSLIKEYENGN